MIPDCLKFLSAFIMFLLIVPLCFALMFDACVGQTYLSKKGRRIICLFLIALITFEIMLFVAGNLYNQIPLKEWIG